MVRKSTFKGLAGLTAVAVVSALGLSACGGGGGGGAAAVPTTPSGYTALDARPAAATTAVGTSPAALSSAIGISGAARVSGSIPSPVGSGTARSARNPLLVAKTNNQEKAARKLAQAGKNPLIADTPENRALVQGYWWDASGAGEHIAVIGEDVYDVYLNSGGCTATIGDNVTNALPYVTVTSTTLAYDDGVDSGSWTSDTTGQIEACVDSATAGAGAGIVSNVGQVSFSDNSTFSYSFTATTTPTAIFVQIAGASEYFVIPLSALTVNGTTYSFNFFGPTPSDAVTQVINQLLDLPNGIVIQAFYGTATPTELLTSTFPGASTAGNWSAPAYVDCVAQPAGSGDLQFSLTWNTQNDVDLHVIEPNGNEIYYGNSVSVATGGELDVDNTYGYGPENIYWTSTVPSGTYTVFVENYDGEFAASYTLTVTRLGVPTTYTGTLPATSGAESTRYTVTMP